MFHVTTIHSLENGGLEDPSRAFSPDSNHSLTPDRRWHSFENLTDIENDPHLYVAKHNYITSQQGQLSIRKGDQLKITRSSDTGAWVEGTNRNCDTGWLPASYIVKVDSLEKHS